LLFLQFQEAPVCASLRWSWSAALPPKPWIGQQLGFAKAQQAFDSLDFHHNSASHGLPFSCPWIVSCVVKPKSSASDIGYNILPIEASSFSALS
jgi:hypothetical protein